MNTSTLLLTLRPDARADSLPHEYEHKKQINNSAEADRNILTSQEAVLMKPTFPSCNVYSWEQD